MSKFVRQLSIVMAILIMLMGAIGFRYMASKKEPPKKKTIKKELVRKVTTLAVEPKRISSNLEIQGRLAAFRKIDIFSEVSGRLLETGRPFKKGTFFRKGDLLLKIDDGEAQLSLKSQKSSLVNAIIQMFPDLKIDYPASFDQWKNYVDNYNVDRSLSPLPEPLSDQERFFVSSKNLHTQYYNIKSQEERLSKYTVNAPFSGVLTEADIYPGSLVRSGQKMGALMSTSSYELEATVLLSNLKHIKVGNTVDLHSTELEGGWKGKVKRVSDQIDPTTQTVLVYIGVSGPNLREGMYLRGNIKGKAVDNALEIPRDLIVNQNEVFLIDGGSTLKTHNVEIVTMSDEYAVVKGLEPGMTILGEMFPGAYNGQKIEPLVN